MEMYSYSSQLGDLNTRVCFQQKLKPGTQNTATTPAHLVVPANDELQVAHKLPEGLVLREQILGARWNLFLLLEVQVLDLSQNCHQLR